MNLLWMIAALVITFDADTVGKPPADLGPVIGDWMVAEREGARGVLVDGSKWRQGTPSASLAVTKFLTITCAKE